MNVSDGRHRTTLRAAEYPTMQLTQDSCLVIASSIGSRNASKHSRGFSHLGFTLHNARLFILTTAWFERSQSHGNPPSTRPMADGIDYLPTRR